MTVREKLATFIESDRVRNVIIWVILFNAVILGLETSPTVMARAGDVLLTLDHLCLAVFTVELAIKLFALGPRFFRNGWNVFDFVIVGISLVPAAQGLSVLRSLRILRVLRVISFSPSIRKVVEGFIKALPGMGSVFLLTIIVFYVSSVMATKLFGASFPAQFGNLGATALTLFQVMTLEGWADGVVRPVMEVYPYAWVFFIIFILVTTFAVINLLVGLVVNAMQDATVQDEKAADAAYRTELLARLTAIEKRLNEKS
ncbi:MAG: ion transporter [Rhodobacterales bacterium]|nr:ion transporter [Rhodobacterales bacterium]